MSLPRAGLLTQVDRSPEIALALGHALQVEVQSKLMAMKHARPANGAARLTRRFRQGCIAPRHAPSARCRRPCGPVPTEQRNHGVRQRGPGGAIWRLSSAIGRRSHGCRHRASRHPPRGRIAGQEGDLADEGAGPAIGNPRLFSSLVDGDTLGETPASGPPPVLPSDASFGPGRFAALHHQAPQAPELARRQGREMGEQPTILGTHAPARAFGNDQQDKGHVDADEADTGEERLRMTGSERKP